MNLRISKNELRFRITRYELSELIENGSLSMDSPLQLSAQKYLISAEDIENPLQLKESNTQVILIVDKKTLLDFQEQMPSREGIKGEYISNKGVVITLIFEIDVRKSNH